LGPITRRRRSKTAQTDYFTKLFRNGAIQAEEEEDIQEDEEG